MRVSIARRGWSCRDGNTVPGRRQNAAARETTQADVRLHTVSVVDALGELAPWYAPGP
jgi:hypothetical protein